MRAQHWIPSSRLVAKVPGFFTRGWKPPSQDCQQPSSAIRDAPCYHVTAAKVHVLIILKHHPAFKSIITCGSSSHRVRTGFRCVLGFAVLNVVNAVPWLQKKYQRWMGHLSLGILPGFGTPHARSNYSNSRVWLVISITCVFSLPVIKWHFFGWGVQNLPTTNTL